MSAVAWRLWKTFVLDFPDSYGVIEKVKFDGDIYKADDSNLVVGPRRAHHQR